MARPPARGDIERHLPLKPLVFQVLLALADGERHGWSLVREVQLRGGFARIMPGNFYRTLRLMLAGGLIAESPTRPAADEDDERRRYFKLTPLGERVASAEAKRLEAIVVEARAKRLLAKSRG
jgi:DNA-binding PadR family transcriptional regulator